MLNELKYSQKTQAVIIETVNILLKEVGLQLGDSHIVWTKYSGERQRRSVAPQAGFVVVGSYYHDQREEAAFPLREILRAITRIWEIEQINPTTLSESLM